MKHIIIFILIFGTLISKGQDCPDNNIYFYSQDDISNFPNAFPQCHEISHSVFIKSVNGTITDLSPLEGITKIKGGLRIINNPSLQSLYGLGNLTEVYDYLSIIRNDSLVSLEGLDSLTFTRKFVCDSNAILQNIDHLASLQYVADTCRFRYLPQLSNVNGLANLDSVGGNLNFRYLPNLTDLTGLQNIKTIGKGLQIKEVGKLESLDGLQSLTTVGYSLNIEKNPRLKNLNGLNNLTIISSGLRIHHNNKLKNLNGLQSLEKLGGGLFISFNNHLKNLNGLSDVLDFGGEMIIRGNHSLTDINGIAMIPAENVNRLLLIQNDSLNICDIDLVCSLLGMPESEVSISGNNSSCESIDTVSAQCGITGLADLKFKPLTIYPNPVRRTLYIKNYNSQIPFKILDSYGKILLSGYLDSKSPKTIDVSGLPRGIIFFNASIFSYKILIID